MAGRAQKTDWSSLAPQEDQPLHEFAQKAYLEYAMYVILDRALPHITDGLKPVQRRIIYAMWELGLKSTAKAKKSARTVGDVLGKFHPHGDVPCYEAMVSIAQPFSCRYPLIHGQGNWGSRDDPKSFAAMRYTEARLSAYAAVLLAEIKQGAVDWAPNFDGSLQEPQCLPARLPNLLLNGATGIAVGMSTDIPPHHCGEVIDATLHLLTHPDATAKALCAWIKGPDFPGGGDIITPSSALIAMYETGQGSVKMRAVYHEEAGNIIIDALPHQASGAKILGQIALQMQNKTLALIADVRDESDHQCPVRLVIVPHSQQIDIDTIMAHLFATTDLERHYRVNMNVIGLDGRPAVKNLATLLHEWITFRKNSLTRQLTYRRDHVIKRLHIVAGLLVAYVHIDRVIKIVRDAAHPQSALIKALHITATQADAILEMKLRQLAKLESLKLHQEHDALQAEKKQLDHCLSNPDALRDLMRQALMEDKARFSDQRRCRIVVRPQAKALATQALVTVEPITVILSQNGWIRAAKGHEIDPSTLRYKSGDTLRTYVRGYSNQWVVILDSTGRTYALTITTLPSARTQGEPLTKYLSPPEGAIFIAMMSGEPTQRYVLVSQQAYGFIGQLSAWCTKNRHGRSVVKLSPNGTLLPPIALPAKQPAQASTDASHWVAVVSLTGRLLCFPIDELPVLTKGKGNKLMQLQGASGPATRASKEARTDGIVALTLFTQGQSLRILAGQRHFKLRPKDIEAYKGHRARAGSLLPRGFQRVDAIEVYGDAVS